MWKLLTIGCLVLSGTAVEDFEPLSEADTELERSFRVTRDMSITETSSGEGSLGSDRSEDTSYSLELTINDKYEAVEDNSATKILREYAVARSDFAIESSSEHGGDSSDEGETEFVVHERKVRFEVEDDEINVEYADDGDDSVEIDWLAMDLEFRGLLPEEPMEEEGQWDIPLSMYDSLLSPMGEEPVEKDEDAEEPVVEIEGDFTATFLEVVEKGGVRYAKVELALSLVKDSDGSEVSFSVSSVDGEGETLTPESQNITKTETISGEGVALWHIEERRWHSFKLTSELTVEDVMEVVLKIEDTELEINNTTIREGKEVIEFEFSR